MQLRDEGKTHRVKKGLTRLLAWVSFALGWIGVFLPGLPTTIFWIIASFAFLRSNPKMYARIVAHKRFGPAVRLYVEEGRISARGKAISIGAMLLFAGVGAIAMGSPWARILVLGLAAAGSFWVALIPLAGKKTAALPPDAEPLVLTKD